MIQAFMKYKMKDGCNCLENNTVRSNQEKNPEIWNYKTNTQMLIHVDHTFFLKAEQLKKVNDWVYLYWYQLKSS